MAAPSNGTQNGGSDYSAQWAEYYRSIGKVKEAEAIEAQMKQKVVMSMLSTELVKTYLISLIFS